MFYVKLSANHQKLYGFFILKFVDKWCWLSNHTSCIIAEAWSVWYKPTYVGLGIMLLSLVAKETSQYKSTWDYYVDRIPGQQTVVIMTLTHIFKTPKHQISVAKDWKNYQNLYSWIQISEPALYTLSSVKFRIYFHLLVSSPCIWIIHPDLSFFSRLLNGRTRTATFTDDIFSVLHVQRTVSWVIPHHIMSYD